MALDLSGGIDYDPHAEMRMRIRRVTGNQVERLLQTYDLAYPARPL